MTSSLRAALLGIVLFACSAVPARATPISFAFQGTVNPVFSGAGMMDFFPGLVAGAPFSGTLTFAPDTNPNTWVVDLKFLSYEADGFGARLTPPDVTQSIDITTTFQRMLTPVASGISVNVDWIRFSLSPGWQSGQLEFLAEGFNPGLGTFENALWHGDITSIQSVPEPATLTLGLLGLGGDRCPTPRKISPPEAL